MAPKGNAMIETTVESIRVSLVTQQRVVILKEVGGDRHLPIWIGSYEAEAIAMELQGVAPTRPLPYDLMQTMLGELNASVDQIVIADLTDQVFYARIALAANGSTIEIDSRPSDAIALAVRTGSRILVEDAVMEAAGVAIDEDDDSATLTAGTHLSGSTAEAAPDTERSDAAPAPSDEQLSVFRDFINSLDLDDFGKKQSN
jgi:bifunctional DNase/RNase